MATSGELPKFENFENLEYTPPHRNDMSGFKIKKQRWYELKMKKLKRKNLIYTGILLAVLLVNTFVVLDYFKIIDFKDGKLKFSSNFYITHKRQIEEFTKYEYYDGDLFSFTSNNFSVVLGKHTFDVSGSNNISDDQGVTWKPGNTSDQYQTINTYRVSYIGFKSQRDDYYNGGIRFTFIKTPTHFTVLRTLNSLTSNNDLKNSEKVQPRLYQVRLIETGTIRDINLTKTNKPFNWVKVLIQIITEFDFECQYFTNCLEFIYDQQYFDSMKNKS